MRLIDADKTIGLLKTRLYETALNNATVNCDASQLYTECADNRIEVWIDEMPTIEAVPTDFHDKCQQIEIQKRLKLEEAYRSMERTVEKLTKALAETEPVRHAHWVKDRLLSINGWTYGVHICPLCGMSYQDIGYRFNYCPNCGAKMDEVTE